MAINRYVTPIEQTLEQYVPIPFQEMFQAGQAIQQRGDQAQAAQDAAQIGLASMEALAPAQREFVRTYSNDFTKQAGDLLQKYGNNTSDPQFVREAAKLRMQFAADPRLKIIQQTNQALKADQEVARKLSASGVKYLDPNRNFTGADQQGNLIAPTGNIRGTNFDEDLTKAFLQIRDNMVDNGRGWKTNKPNLDQLANNLQRNLDTNPVTRDAIEYYKQQGLSDTQARQATQGLIRQAYTDNLRTDRDYAYDQLQLAYRREAREASEFQAKLSAKKNQGIPGLVPEVSPIAAADLNKDLIKGVDNTLSRLNKVGGLAKSVVQTVADTPENRKKYAGKFTEIPKYAAASSGTGAAPAIIGTELRLNTSTGNTYNPDEVAVLRTAREQMGNLAKNPETGSYLKDKTVLERYKQFLQADNAAYTFWNTQSGDVLKHLDSVYVGSKGEKLGNASVVNDKGKLLKTAGKDFNIGDYDGFSFSGISAAPMEGFPNGAIKVNAINKKDGKIAQFLKPLDPQTAGYFMASNKGYRALTSGKSNEDIAKDRSNYIPTEEGYFLLPQKNTKGSIDLYPIDANGKKLSNGYIPFEAYEQQEREAFNQYITGFTNKG